MSEPKSSESWQVDVNGQVYQADFAELADWIAEGALLPDDKVRRGNLRWIEARKVLTLTPFFNAKANGSPPPVVVSTTIAEEHEQSTPAAISDGQSQTFSAAGTGVTYSEPVAPVSPPVPTALKSDPNVCVNHADRPSKFVCPTCSLTFCRECVKSFGSSVTVCAACGGMCKPKKDLESEQRAHEFRSAAIGKGFGFGDFGAAIAYPFKFKTSLFFGALMFMFFSIGQSASAMGGIYMVVASIFAYMLANMLTFGILANTVDNFAQGKIGVNFMPSFEDFSLWDDIIHPFFLSVGVYISSFGAFVVVLVIGMYLVVSSVTSQVDSVKKQVDQTPGTPNYDIPRTLKQSDDVKNVLGNTQKQNAQRLQQQEQIANGQQPAPAVNQEEEDFQRINKMIADSKRKELESVVGKSPETREKESQQMMAGLLRLAAPIVVIGFIALVWGLFYFPVACAVAGYTRSFTATINPLVGLDTIKRLGFDYVKILFMALLLAVASGIISAVLGLIFVAFDMQGVGNLPAKAIGSLFSFYFAIVFSCLLGFAIFKASDRLRLSN